MAGPVAKIKATRARVNSRTGAANLEGLLRDKVLFDNLMQGAGLPTPRTLGVVDPQFFLVFGPDRTAHPLKKLPKLLRGASAFCKPARGKGGQGSFRVDFDHRGRAHLKDVVLSAGEFEGLVRERLKARGRHRGSRRLLVQERIINEPAIGAVYDGCVNTLRLLTHYKGDHPSAFSAVLRVGAHGNSVDNWDAGGLVVPVDLDRGRTTGPGVVKKSREQIPHHPDTGTDLVGVTLPHFRQARETAEAAHRLFPDLLTIGWDLALTPTGPMILEANVKWDITMHYITDSKFYPFVMGELFEEHTGLPELA